MGEPDYEICEILLALRHGSGFGLWLGDWFWASACANLEILRFVLLRSFKNRAVLVPDPRKYVIYDHLRVFTSCVTPVVRAMIIITDLVAIVLTIELC